MNDLFEEEKPTTVVDKKKGTYESGRTYISYSQYAQWVKCPFSWKLDKIDKLGKFEGSIATIFGTAIHEPIQDFLTIMYLEGTIKAEQFDYLSRFKEVFRREFEKETGKGAVITLAECKEHIEDGEEILKYILNRKNRKKIFPPNGHSLVGVEIELDEELPNRVKFKAFLDIVLLDETTGKIKIIDIKTSKQGWNKYQKADVTKIDQILLYKKFYSQRFDVKESDIKVAFVILKRQLYEDVDFYQTPVQNLVPPSSKKYLQESVDRLHSFVHAAFDQNGNKNVSAKFPKNPGKGKKNCKYCPFATMIKDGKSVCDRKDEVN